MSKVFLKLATILKLFKQYLHDTCISRESWMNDLAGHLNWLKN